MLAKFATKMAQKGREVQTCLQGTGGDTLLVAGSPASMYSLSAPDMRGCEAGVSEARRTQSSSQTRHAPPSV